MPMTDDEKMEVCTRIMEILDACGRDGASCGDIMEILCNILGSAAIGMADKLDVPKGEIVADVTSITLEGLQRLDRETADEGSS